MLNKRTLKDGVVQYLVKWTDLGYAESTWEDEDEEIPELPLYIQYYEDLRYVCGVDGAKKKKKKKKGEGEEEERPRKYNPPPDKPTTSLDVKYKVRYCSIHKYKSVNQEKVMTQHWLRCRNSPFFSF